MSDESWSHDADVAAREAWPGIELAAEAFREHLARKQEELGGRSSHRGLRTSDLYFALGCAQRDASALGFFKAVHGPMLARVFARLKLPGRRRPTWARSCASGSSSFGPARRR